MGSIYRATGKIFEQDYGTQNIAAPQSDGALRTIRSRWSTCVWAPTLLDAERFQPSSEWGMAPFFAPSTANSSNLNVMDSLREEVDSRCPL